MQTGFFWLVFNPLKSSPLGVLPAEMGAWQQPSLPKQYLLSLWVVSIGTGSPEPRFSAALIPKGYVLTSPQVVL